MINEEQVVQKESPKNTLRIKIKKQIYNGPHISQLAGSPIHCKIYTWILYYTCRMMIGYEQLDEFASC